MNLDQDMQAAVEAYIKFVKNDYATRPGREDTDEIGREVYDEMTKDFVDNMGFSVGKKYVKILRKGSVHSFIVLTDTPKFKRGAVLMAASFAAPATNFARADVFDSTTWPRRVRWTGAI